MRKITINLFLTILLFFPFGLCVCQNIDIGNLPVEKFHNITLEMSLKPFKSKDKAYIKAVCQKAFSQWVSLLKHADTVSVMLWTADGSEILSYTGNLSQRLEWAMYIGNPNTEHEVNSKPETLSLHERAYTYMDNPPEFSYADLRFVVNTLKKEGEKITGKPVRVGATFDPGPEFAKSPFKYKIHPEICMGNTMGTKTFVCCYATLNEDGERYAGFPDGIPQGTPFGTFFGRQSQIFLTDMGFDFIWFSNGFGFGMETWSATGAIFDGKKFQYEKLDDVRGKINDFWTKFRNECPDIRVETRGTNISVGADLAKDGVDIRTIYNGGFNLLPPPNSPWAALDGDFGLEMAGYMSRIAELPDERYLFRFYTHDPWWANSPWLDRYGREAHDIYLPMSVARINGKGEMKLPTHLNFLSIDDSYGNMPDQVPDEVIPHILQARRISPDKAGLVVWVYPFDEYHDWTFNKPERIEEVFYGDWFIRQAMNDGFPINTVVSTTNFSGLIKDGYSGFDESVIVTIVPEAGSVAEASIIQFVKNGGKAIIYGPVAFASKEFLDFINISVREPLSGEFFVSSLSDFDNVKKPSPLLLRHNESMSGGGIETVSSGKDPKAEILVNVKHGNEKRDIVVLRKDEKWNGGAICYVRGTNSATFRGGKLLTPDDPESFFTGGSLMRYGLDKIGYSIHYDKPLASLRNPVNVISRHDNAFYFAGYVPNQIVEHLFHFPQGAPVFTGMDTELKKGFSAYRLPKSWSKECRVFVEQNEGILSCHELAPVELNIKRKINITGLKDATVRFYAGNDETRFKAMSANNHHPARPDTLVSVKNAGNYYEYKNVTGQLVFSW
ncbi:MAG: hypothetical protein LBJ72_11165 [Dysgonamonadaceae bacterium]|jgi:hypothetical protein|nr:hypothetical protein [Dysgonamonadaceae bacterium]